MSVKTANKKVRVSQKSKAKLNNYCKWCGEPFKKYHNRQMYCCDEHRIAARQEQKIQYNRKYRSQFKHSFNEKQKYGLGSGFLSMHRKDVFNDESVSIIKEMKRLGIR